MPLSRYHERYLELYLMPHKIVQYYFYEPGCITAIMPGCVAHLYVLFIFEHCATLLTNSYLRCGKSCGVLFCTRVRRKRRCHSYKSPASNHIYTNPFTPKM